MKLKHTIRSLCLSMQIFCLLAGSSFNMTVLCRAENGHVAIEAAAADGCAKPSTRRSADDAPDSTTNTIASNDDCGNCTDIRLSIGAPLILKQTSQISIAASTPVAAVFAEDPVDSPLHHLPCESGAKPLYFDPLRSIVLLV